MTPEHAIERLGEMRDQMNRLAHAVQLASDAIGAQWRGLGQAGGQRADHAALLLSRLRPALRDLAAFCTTCEQQIDAFMADPFQRNG